MICDDDDLSILEGSSQGSLNVLNWLLTWMIVLFCDSIFSSRIAYETSINAFNFMLDQFLNRVLWKPYQTVVVVIPRCCLYWWRCLDALNSYCFAFLESLCLVSMRPTKIVFVEVYVDVTRRVIILRASSLQLVHMLRRWMMMTKRKMTLALALRVIRHLLCRTSEFSFGEIEST